MNKVLGYEKVIEAFGKWPAFHDAYVDAISIYIDTRDGDNICECYLSLNTEQVAGLATHPGAPIVDFKFIGIDEIKLTNLLEYKGSVIFDLRVKENEAGVVVAVDLSCGLNAYFEAESIEVFIFNDDDDKTKAFEEATTHVLEKNQELYERL